MSKRFKQNVFVLLCLLLVFVAGCGNNDNKSPSSNPSEQPDETNSTPPENEQVTLRISYWAGAQTTIDKTNAAIELFEKKYPNIKIVSEYSPLANYMEKLNIQAASNNLPDVMRLLYPDVKLYAGKNLLLPVDDYINGGEINLEGADPIHLKSGMVDGKTYAINPGNNAYSFVYDPELFEKAGVPEPTMEWTWSDYEHALKSFKDKLGIYGDSHLNKDQFRIFIRQRGGHLFNEDGTALGYEDDKIFSDFVGMQLDWQRNGWIPPIGESLEAQGLEDTAFAKGKAAMGNMYTNTHLELLETHMQKKLKLAVTPGSKNGGMFIQPTFMLAIAKNSKHPKEAAAFIDFWVNDIGANKEFKAFFGAPYIPSVLEGVLPSYNEAQNRLSKYIVDLESIAEPLDPPNPSNAEEIFKLLKNISNEVFFERLSPEEAAKKFRTQANDALAKNK